MDTKNIVESKTFWVNLALGLLPAVLPYAQQAVSEHPAVSAGLGAVANILLRLVTSKPVSVLPES